MVQVKSSVYAKLSPPVVEKYDDYQKYLNDFENYCRFVDRRPDVGFGQPGLSLSDTVRLANGVHGYSPSVNSLATEAVEPVAQFLSNDNTNEVISAPCTPTEAKAGGEQKALKATVDKTKPRKRSSVVRFSPVSEPEVVPIPKLSEEDKRHKWISMLEASKPAFEKTFKASDSAPFNVICAACEPYVTKSTLEVLLRMGRLPKTIGALERYQDSLARLHRNGRLGKTDKLLPDAVLSHFENNPPS